MASSTALVVQSLKTHLKLRGLTYGALAKTWKVSLSSVKRIMSGPELSIARIESACELMHLSVGDFFKQIQFDHSSELFYLTTAQENHLSQDLEALHYFLLLHEGWSPSEIFKEYSLTQAKNIRLLNFLEKIDLIEVHPNNRIKRKYVGQLRLHKDGPLGKQLAKLVKTQFLESNFAQGSDLFTFLNLNFVPGDVQKLKARFLEMAKELSLQSDENRRHPNSQSCGLMIALRPWSSPFSQALKKRKHHFTLS